MQNPSPLEDGVGKQAKEELAIVVVAVYVAPLIASAGDMPNSAGMLKTKLTGHGVRA
jgi:hypothetical protein